MCSASRIPACPDMNVHGSSTEQSYITAPRCWRPAAGVQVKKGYVEARKADTIKLPDNAIEPPCPHFWPCGGCNLQHLPYQAQLDAKLERLKFELQRQLGRSRSFDPSVVDEHVLPCPQELR